MNHHENRAAIGRAMFNSYRGGFHGKPAVGAEDLGRPPGGFRPGHGDAFVLLSDRYGVFPGQCVCGSRRIVREVTGDYCRRCGARQ